MEKYDENPSVIKEYPINSQRTSMDNQDVTFKFMC